MAGPTLADIVDPNWHPETKDDWDSLEYYTTQLFRPAAPIVEDGFFAGRFAQARALLDVIYQPGGHAILYGERGVGKTSLVNIINERIIAPAKYTHVLKVGCNVTDTFATIWSNVFFNYTWKERTVADIIRENPQPFTVYKIAESLDQRTLVIIDEFDRVGDALTKTLIADTIKYLSDNPATRFTVVVVGVGKSIAELFGSHPSIQRCCEQIQMPRMSAVELQQIADTRWTQLRMHALPEVVERMTKFAQGLPGYMHLLGQLATLAAINGRSQLIDLSHLKTAVENALERADESTRTAYYRAIQSTKPDNRYREVLLACALAKKNEIGQFSASAVCEPYSEIRGAAMGIEHFARHLDTFCDPARGPVLVKFGKRRGFMYQFANPLLEPLVVMIGQHGPTGAV
jgi:Cdc6-like AAA superfamily ATPase